MRPESALSSIDSSGWEETFLPQHLTFVGLHIPKCAGTSILDIARSSLNESEFFQSTSILQNYQSNKLDFLYTRKDNLKLVWGHTIHEEMLKFFGQRVRLFTGLRHPIERFKSELNYLVRLAKEQGRPPPDLSNYVHKISNPICKFLISHFPTIAGDAGSLADRGMRILSACNHVYFSENFNETVGILFAAMGLSIRPVKSNSAPNDVQNFEIDQSKHLQDLDLYNRALGRFKERSIKDSLNLISPLIADFIANPVNRNVLREFLWEASAGEFCDWGFLKNVIIHRREQLGDMISEISYYEKKLRSL